MSPVGCLTKSSWPTSRLSSLPTWPTRRRRPLACPHPPTLQVALAANKGPFCPWPPALNVELRRCSCPTAACSCSCKLCDIDDNSRQWWRREVSQSRIMVAMRTDSHQKLSVLHVRSGHISVVGLKMRSTMNVKTLSRRGRRNVKPTTLWQIESRYEGRTRGRRVNRT